jgi:hypothetical protein
MKVKKNIHLIALAALAIASCNHMEDPIPETGREAIILTSRSSLGASLATRANGEYISLANGTKLRLKVSGDWIGKTPFVITETPLATIGNATTVDLKKNDGTVIASAVNANAVSFTADQQPYWDDFGTADPGNTTGRAKGLTIYGIAVNDAGTTTLSAPTDWTSLSWTLPADQTSGWTANDLLISNNIQSDGISGNYIFDKRTDGKSLIFTHAMSKITVNLTAGDGFTGGKFTAAPTATLKGFNLAGTVNIATGATTTTGTATDIKPLCETNPAAGASTVTCTALVYPGRALAATDVLASVGADGNNFVVRAAKLIDAIVAAESIEAANAKLLAGKNYIINITINKTAIDVTATIKDWIDVQATLDSPKIDVSTSYGQTGTAFENGFSFFLSTSEAKDYGTASGALFASNSEYSYADGTYTPTVQLYWPDQSTAYYFRAIYPSVTTTATATDAPKVSLSGEKQVVEVSSAAWNATTFPCNLMLGMPRDANGNKIAAIKATEGVIRMNFQYAMARVTVNIESSASSDPNYIAFGEGTKVEITGGYTSGSINLSDGSANMGAATADYTMDKGTTTANKFTCDDAVLPQSLGNMQFKITVVNAKGEKIYTTVEGIKNIKSTIDGTLQSITEWKAGYHYTYTLKITETEVKVIATITDWTAADGGTTDVWM